MSLHDDTSDAALFAASAEDPEAFVELYRRYERPLLGYFGSRTHDPELAADLTGEVFAVMLKRSPHFDEDRAPGGSAAPWVFGIARRVLLESLRRGRVAQAARKQMGMQRIAFDDDAYARLEEIVSMPPDLDDLVAALPDSQRSALLARVVEERDYSEIAAQLHCSELVARKRVSRALGTLRGALKANPKENTT